MSHDRNQSILYKVTSPQMLADRLLISREELDALLADADPYKRWIDKKLMPYVDNILAWRYDDI